MTPLEPLVRALGIKRIHTVGPYILAQVEAAVTANRNALDEAVLRAPFAGTIGAVLVQAGERVTPQVPVIRLGDLTRLRIRTEDLNESDINLVRIGQAATVTIDAVPDRVFHGAVASVAPLAGDRRGSKVYEVLVDLELPENTGLRWGMSAFVEIRVK